MALNLPGERLRFSVVIPAHNEAGVIARCLAALLDGAPAGEPEIVVVCNGCTDATAQIARSFGPPVRVIELATGSKPLALNTGNAAAEAVPRFFVDADIVVGYASLAAVAGALATDKPLAGAPALEADLSRASPAVKRFFKIWMRLPYVQNGLVGAGVYGLSAGALARLGRFPDIIGDDLYIIRLFSENERVSIAVTSDGKPARFTLFPPRTLADLVRVEMRRRAGDEEMEELFGRQARSTPGQFATLVRLSLTRPDLWPALLTYLYVKIECRRRYASRRRRGAPTLWQRDESSRTAN